MLITNTEPHPSAKSKTLQTACISATQILDQGLELLHKLPQDHYRLSNQKSYSASIGGHYRHSLEHFVMLLDGIRSGKVNYDARERNRRVEEDPCVARQWTMELKIRLIKLPEETNDIPLVVLSKLQYNSEIQIEARSTLQRELMYGTTHAIHHYAIIALMVQHLEIQLPATFGIAPSTVQHQSTEATTKD